MHRHLLRRAAPLSPLRPAKLVALEARRHARRERLRSWGGTVDSGWDPRRHGTCSVCPPRSRLLWTSRPHRVRYTTPHPWSNPPHAGGAWDQGDAKNATGGSPANRRRRETRWVFLRSCRERALSGFRGEHNRPPRLAGSDATRRSGRVARRRSGGPLQRGRHRDGAARSGRGGSRTAQDGDRPRARSFSYGRGRWKACAVLSERSPLPIMPAAARRTARQWDPLRGPSRAAVWARRQVDEHEVADRVHARHLWSQVTAGTAGHALPSSSSRWRRRTATIQRAGIGMRWPVGSANRLGSRSATVFAAFLDLTASGCENVPDPVAVGPVGQGEQVPIAVAKHVHRRAGEAARPTPTWETIAKPGIQEAMLRVRRFVTRLLKRATRLEIGIGCTRDGRSRCASAHRAQN